MPIVIAKRKPAGSSSMLPITLTRRTLTNRRQLARDEDLLGLYLAALGASDGDEAAALIPDSHEALVGRLARAAQLLSAGEARNLFVAQREGWIAVHARVHGEQHLLDAALGKRRAQLVQRPCDGDAERPARRTR